MTATRRPRRNRRPRGSLASPPVPVFGRGEVLLTRRGIDGRVLLTGELPNSAHDLISHRPARLGRRPRVGVVFEGHWLTDAHLDRADPGYDPSWWQYMVRTDHRHWNDWQARREREPANPSPAAVQLPVWRAGSFRVDAEQLSTAQQVERGFEHAAGSACSGPVNRQLPGAAQVEGGCSVNEPGPGEVLGFGCEGHRTVKHERQEERVDDRQMVRGQNGAPLPRDALRAGDHWPPQQAKDWPRDDPRDAILHPSSRLHRASGMGCSIGYGLFGNARQIHDNGARAA